VNSVTILVVKPIISLWYLESSLSWRFSAD